MSEKIELQPYSDQNADKAAGLIGRIGSIFPESRIEHIGSTAIAGLLTKPIIDIMIEWPESMPPEDVVTRMEDAGFWHWFLDLFRDQRLMFVFWTSKGSTLVRSSNIHAARFGSPFWQDQITFRDALRESVELASEYASLKQELARRFPFDLDSYTQGKGDFIRHVLRQQRCRIKGI